VKKVNRHRLLRVALVVANALALVSGVDASVTLRAGVDRDSITVGDPVRFRVRIYRDRGDSVAVAAGEGNLGSLEVRSALEPRIRELDGGRIEETRDLVVTSYRTGEFELPAAVAVYRTAAGDTGRVSAPPVPIVVRSVKPEDADDIRDIKLPALVAGRVPLWLWLTTAGLVAAAGAVVWYVRRRRRRPAETPPPPPVDWPLEIAKIGRMGLLEKGDYKAFYSLLSDAFRRYVEERTGVEAMERTTHEISRDLRGVPIREEKVLDAEGFLSEADLVKFAKYNPPHPRAQGAVDRVLDLIGRLNSEPIGQDGSDSRAPATETAEVAR